MRLSCRSRLNCLYNFPNLPRSYMQNLVGCYRWIWLLEKWNQRDNNQVSNILWWIFSSNCNSSNFPNSLNNNFNEKLFFSTVNNKNNIIQSNTRPSTPLVWYEKWCGAAYPYKPIFFVCNGWECQQLQFLCGKLNYAYSNKYACKKLFIYNNLLIQLSKR